MKDNIRDNYLQVSATKYVVWTQAGFKQACNHFKKEHYSLEHPIKGYPLSYPSYIRFVAGYEGYHYSYCSRSPLSKAIKDLENEIYLLESIDSNHKLNA